MPRSLADLSQASFSRHLSQSRSPQIPALIPFSRSVIAAADRARLRPSGGGIGLFSQDGIQGNEDARLHHHHRKRRRQLLCLLPGPSRCCSRSRDQGRNRKVLSADGLAAFPFLQLSFYLLDTWIFDLLTNLEGSSGTIDCSCSIVELVQRQAHIPEISCLAPPVSDLSGDD